MKPDPKDPKDGDGHSYFYFDQIGKGQMITFGPGAHKLALKLESKRPPDEPLYSYRCIVVIEVLRDLVWRMPMREAAREVGLSDVGLKKACVRLGIKRPPQGYWSTPPERRAKFLERAWRKSSRNLKET